VEKLGPDMPYADELREFVRRVLALLGDGTTVILYGSMARGDYGDWSDVDLVIISDELHGNPLERTERLIKLNRGLYMPLEIAAYTREGFLRALRALSPTALDALVEGVVLHDDGFLAEARAELARLVEELELVREGRCWWSLRRLREALSRAGEPVPG